MLGEKERFYIPQANKFQGIEPVCMLQILGTENSKLFWRYKETQLGWLGWDKGRFKLLHFTNTTISFTLPPSLHYVTIKFLSVRKLCEFKITGAYSTKAVQTKTATRQFLIWWKSYMLYCLYWHLSKKFMPRKWNADEGFCLKILYWGLKKKLPFND